MVLIVCLSVCCILNFFCDCFEVWLDCFVQKLMGQVEDFDVGDHGLHFQCFGHLLYHHHHYHHYPLQHHLHEEADFHHQPEVNQH